MNLFLSVEPDVEVEEKSEKPGDGESRGRELNNSLNYTPGPEIEKEDHSPSDPDDGSGNESDGKD